MSASDFAPEIPARGAGEPLHVLLILGHPRKTSLCAALADAFVSGAREAEVAVQKLVLADLDFDPNGCAAAPIDPVSAAAIRYAQELVRWADHLVFVYPNWWGTMPALQKGFLDCTIAPGFAFAARADGKGWVPLLKGKTAQLITTMDMPRWVYRLIYREPGNNAMKRSVLGFCGVRTARILNCGPVKDADEAQRARWLAQAHHEGRRLAGGVLTPMQKTTTKIAAWVKALRLQFYPMAWVVYTVGAFGVATNAGHVARGNYWWGYCTLLFLEVATVFCNDYFDFAADRGNRNFGPFNGGSRVLVDRDLGFGEIRAGIATALVLTVVSASALMAMTPAPSGATLTVLAAMVIITLGYTVPPLKLIYRGIGELDVGVTHSIGVLLCGYVFQGGNWLDPFPWLVSLPLGLSILPSIILSNIPDYDADRRVAKKTLPVLLGPRVAIGLALMFTVLAALAAVTLQQSGLLRVGYGTAIYAIVIHGSLLAALLYGYLRQYQSPGRIDALIAAALSYMLWFGVTPLIGLS